MPFGLKNAGATYQRMMQNCLIWQIGRNVEVYVDVIVIKSAEGSSLLADLAETFQSLRSYNIKLNQKSVYLVCQPESYSDSWFLKEELKLTQRR